MAYDLLFRTIVPKNIALTASIVDDRPLSADPMATTDADKAYLAQLAVTKMNADAGNVKAKKDWQRALKQIAGLKSKAKKGDKRAARTLTVLNESGLFAGVSAMSISGAYSDDFTQPEKKLLAVLGNVKLKANQGNPKAIKLVSAIKNLAL